MHMGLYTRNADRFCLNTSEISVSWKGPYSSKLYDVEVISEK